MITSKHGIHFTDVIIWIKKRTYKSLHCYNIMEYRNKHVTAN